MKTRKILALVLALTMIVAVFAGCGKKKTENSSDASGISDISVGVDGSAVDTSNSTPSGTDGTIGINGNGVPKSSLRDSSDLPDWTGKQLSITYWIASGTGGNRALTPAPNDVVTPEIKRVTGVTVNEDDSFDNGGQAYKAKLGLINSSGKWPTIAFGVEDISQLLNTGKIYDLTDYIKQYCPNLTAILNNRLYYQAYRGIVPSTIKNVTLPYDLDIGNYYRMYDMDFTNSPYATYSDPSAQTYFYIRDDILKELYPSAKTYKEMQALYVKNGHFTKSEVLDIQPAIKTKEDFKQLLVRIKNLNKTVNGRPVYPIFADSGQDGWAFISWLGGQLFGMPVSNVSYFTYWDVSTKKVEIMLDQPIFKEELKFLNSIVRDGLTDRACFTEPYETTIARMHRGEYAISYAFHTPDNAVVEKNSGGAFYFRKAYFEIPVDTSRYLIYPGWGFGGGVGSGSQFVVFKKGITEEQLPQFLKYYDFLISEEGQKLYSWGPRSAGLFTEDANGVRQFTKDELVKDVINGVNNGSAARYGLIDNYTLPAVASDRLKINLIAKGQHLWSPPMYYPKTLKGEDTNNNFHYGYEVKVPTYDAFSFPHCYVFGYSGAKKIQAFWGARVTMEEPMVEAVAAADDTEFEAKYDKMMRAAKAAGLNQDLKDEYNKYNKEELNAGDKYTNLLKQHQTQF